MLALRDSRSCILPRTRELKSGVAMSVRSVSAGTSSRLVASSATTSAVRGLPVSAAISPKTSPAPRPDRDRYSPLLLVEPATVRPESTK